MKNKKMLLFAGVLAAFLMLAVPFAVVSFDAEDVNAADADSDGYYGVGDWDALVNALTAKEPKIRFTNDITYVSDMIKDKAGLLIDYSVEIDGAGHELTRDLEGPTNYRFVYINDVEESGEVTIKRLTINFAGGPYSRTINVGEVIGLTLNIYNSKINNETHYPINLTDACSGVNLTIDESELNGEDGDIIGYCALNIWGTGHTVNITDSTLVGHNMHKENVNANSFSTIMINGDSSADISIFDSTIKASSITANNQRAVYFNTGSDGSLKISGDSTVEMDAPGYAMVFLNEGIRVDLESLTLTTTKNENLIYTESDIKFGNCVR